MLNNITIMGRLVKDPDVRKTTSGKSVCTFTIANERPKQNDSEKVTDFLDVTVWNNTAEFVGKYFTKGKPIIATGRLQTRTWKDDDGKNRKEYVIMASQVEFVPIEKGASVEEPINDDELPF